MEDKDILEFNLDELSLEPLEEPSAAPVASPTASKFKIDTRGKCERRTHEDRRNSIRFEADRREAEDRRAGPKPWARGTDL